MACRAVGLGKGFWDSCGVLKHKDETLNSGSVSDLILHIRIHIIKIASGLSFSLYKFGSSDRASRLPISSMGWVSSDSGRSQVAETMGLRRIQLTGKSYARLSQLVVRIGFLYRVPLRDTIRVL